MSLPRPVLLLIFLALAALNPSLSAGQAESQIPLALLPWADAAYAERFFLKIEVPGEGGNANLHRDLFTAGVVLPLRMIGGADSGEHPGTAAPERVLLVGENGISQAVCIRPASDGTGTEVLFRTQPGLRRFCLYTGAPAGKAVSISPSDFFATDMAVELRARMAPADFAASKDNPLTLQRFETLEENYTDGLGTRQVRNIDAPENSFVNVTIDGLGHIQRTENPARYAALYEGFLRAPVSGKYTFALDTPGAGHLVIDGRPVVSLDAPDPQRKPFAGKNGIDLTEGLHRLVVHYAEANTGGKTNAELAQFGLRAHWQPPWSQGLMCIPPQAFARFLPATVVRHELAGSKASPFISLDVLGRVRCGSHLGPAGERELALLVATSMAGDGSGAGATILQFSQNGQTIAAIGPPGSGAGAGGRTAFAWVVTGTDVTVALVPAVENVAARVVRIAPGKPDALDAVNLQGELEIKSAPDFLYVDDANFAQDEAAHIHIETSLSPPPAIILKERMELNFLPPAPHPMGEFFLCWSAHETATNSSGAIAPAIIEATPIENGRRRLRASFTAAQLAPLAADGEGQLLFRLNVGDVVCQTIIVRLLHAGKPWPGTIIAGPGNLFFDAGKTLSPDAPELPAAPPSSQADGTAEFRQYERVLMLVRRQNEAVYRAFAPLKLARADASPVLFLGDPLVEGIGAGISAQSYGLALVLSRDLPKTSWAYSFIPGPHRHLPIFRFLADLERIPAPLPAVVVVSLGQGDVARQTPIYTFERALDALLARLKTKGAKRIVVAGIVPEVGREAQADAYQQRVLDILRQHHVESVDIFHAWTAETNWPRRYAAPKDAGGGGSESSEPSVFTPLPNAEALGEIAKMIEEKLK